jgi:hypothetical protein
MGPRKITMADISFESEAHNIYSPYFSSQPSSSDEEYLSEQYYDEEDESAQRSSDSYDSEFNDYSRSVER